MATDHAFFAHFELRQFAVKVAIGSLLLFGSGVCKVGDGITQVY